MTPNRFKPGDVLVIAPQDGDDPVALACSGQRCLFVRYGEATGHAIVTLESERKRTHVHPRNLLRLEEVQR